jgi:hypothetical protein
MKRVKDHLLLGEEVIGRIPGGMDPIDYYATSSRLLVFGKPGIWLFVLLGVFYFLWPKRYWGSIEYSRISGISLKKHRRYFVLGLFFGAFWTLVGILLLAARVAMPLAVAFIVLGIALFSLFCAKKWAYYQIEAEGLSEKEMKRWRIYRYGARIKTMKIDRFIDTIRQGAGL